MDAITTLIDTVVENPYATYPSVPRTASINGFADRIYDQLPECAKACMYESTGSTPCPYWDTGCLCVMPQFGGAIGQCVADNCQGEAIGSVEYLATSICSSAGVWEPYWFIPESVSEALASAAAIIFEVETTTATATTTEEEVGPTTDAQEGPSADDGASQPTETSSVEEGEGEGNGGEGEDTEEGDGESVEGNEEDQGAKEEEEEDGEESTGEPNDSDETTSNEEGEVTDAAEAEEEGNDKHTQDEVSTSVDSGDNNIGAQAEAASIASELDNGAVTNGVAIGGVISALAALI
nr:uncharacterized protein [Candida metapsilosis]